MVKFMQWLVCVLAVAVSMQFGKEAQADPYMYVGGYNYVINQTHPDVVDAIDDFWELAWLWQSSEYVYGFDLDMADSYFYQAKSMYLSQFEVEELPLNLRLTDEEDYITGFTQYMRVAQMATLVEMNDRVTEYNSAAATFQQLIATAEQTFKNTPEAAALEDQLDDAMDVYLEKSSAVTLYASQYDMSIWMGGNGHLQSFDDSDERFQWCIERLNARADAIIAAMFW